MKRDRGPTNPVVASLIYQLRVTSNKNDAKIWKAVSNKLKKPRRNRPAVNISRLNRYSKADEQILVPGKVLGAGDIDHPITVAALDFSETAKNKIEAAKGKAISINEMMQENPKGNGVRIIG